MDVKTINKKKGTLLLNKIEKFGYWPMLHGNKWKSDNYNLTKLLAHVTLKTNTFIEFYISSDSKNVSRRLISFDQGGLGLGNSARNYYLDTKRYEKQINAYKLYMKNKIILLSEDAGISYNVKEIERNVSEVLEFEIELAKIIVPENDRRNYTKMHNIRHFSNLSSLIDIVSSLKKAISTK